MAKLVIGTRNTGKIVELKELFGHSGIIVQSIGEFSVGGEPEETGATFEQNAIIKSSCYAAAIGRPVLADDSGLEVDFLNGGPGVYSARYAGISASDQENLNKILKDLASAGEGLRTARFRCVMALCDKAGKVLHTTSSECEGRISVKPHGINGFGYDPIFIPKGYSKTFGELASTIKQRLSHRAGAARKMALFLHSNSGLLT